MPPLDSCMRISLKAHVLPYERNTHIPLFGSFFLAYIYRENPSLHFFCPPSFILHQGESPYDLRRGRPFRILAF